MPSPNPSPVGDYQKAHADADTDNEANAIHHSLGKSPNQAAQGNHTHDLTEQINAAIEAALTARGL